MTGMQEDTGVGEQLGFGGLGKLGAFDTSFTSDIGTIRRSQRFVLPPR